MLNYITKYVGIHKYADSILILPILILVFSIRNLLGVIREKSQSLKGFAINQP